jgi:hypothetical protein
MSAGPTALRWFVDETSLGLGKMLAIARTDVVHPGHYLLPSVPPGTTDVDWMPIVAGMSLVVISRDKKIRTKPAEVAAFRAAGLRVFWLAGKKDLSNWDSIKLVIKWWDRMEEIVADRGGGPWFQAVSDGAIREFTV